MNSHTDPSGLWGTVVTVLGAALALAVAFGADLTETQREAILGTATALGPLVTALLIRRYAWAPATVDRRLVEQARALGAPAHPDEI